MQFHAVHRIGRKPEQTSSHEANNVKPKLRHIMARFLCREDRNRVWAKRKMLRDTELFADVFIDEDLSAASLEIKKTLWIARKKGKELDPNAKIFIRGRSLIVNECKYDVAYLPEHLVNLKPKQKVSNS